MYVWLGIDLDSQLGTLKTHCQQAKSQFGMSIQNADFPMHLSLKISFEVANDLFSQLMRDICDYFSTLHAFDVQVDKLECHPNIAWLLYKPCQQLTDISIHLNDFLLANYNVPLHEYDTDFKYHSTMFMDGSETQISQAFQTVKDLPLPSKIHANTFCVGCSPSGKLNTFSVIKRIVVQ